MLSSLVSSSFVKTTSSMWEKYSQVLHRHPVVTKSLISGMLFLGGDVLCQHFEVKNENSPRFDRDRAAQMTIFGTVVNGPMMHAWYKKLDALVPGVGYRAIVKKVALDQVVFAPIFYTVFFTCSSLMKDTVTFSKPTDKTPFSFKRTCECTADMFKTAFVPTLTMDWRVWPVANSINFSVIPQQHRVTFGNVVSVAWNGYLSAVANTSNCESTPRPARSYVRTTFFDESHHTSYIKSVERLMI